MPITFPKGGGSVPSTITNDPQTIEGKLIVKGSTPTVELQDAVGDTQATLSDSGNILLSAQDQNLVFQATGGSEVKVADNGHMSLGVGNFNISSGVITLGSFPKPIINMRAQTSTTDDIDEISGCVTNGMYILKADSTDTITIKHNTGGATNPILTATSADIVLGPNEMSGPYIFDGTNLRQLK